jgi:hypothetical protein
MERRGERLMLVNTIKVDGVFVVCCVFRVGYECFKRGKKRNEVHVRAVMMHCLNMLMPKM